MGDYMDKCICISKNNLEYNLEYYKNNTNKEITAIVKNNAYGHGVKEVSSIIDDKIKYLDETDYSIFKNYKNTVFLVTSSKCVNNIKEGIKEMILND